MPRTLRKLWPELVLAILAGAVGWAVSSPEVMVYAGPGGVVMLQALRRVIRDEQAKRKARAQ